MARPRIPDETRAQIARAYASGRSTVSLGREYGIDPKTVGVIAQEHGVLLRDRGGRRLAAPQPNPDPVPYDGGWRQDGLIQRPRVNVRALGEEAS